MTREASIAGHTEPPATSLWTLAALFLRLGTIGFGGPAAHIALMRDEVVRRRRWLTDQQFMDLLGAAQLVPGPNSTELAIHIGWARRRWAGLLVAGVCFILPAFVTTGVLAWAYVRYGKLPEIASLLWGVKPVIVAIVAEALWKLLPTTVPDGPRRALGIAAVAAATLGAHELAILLCAGLAMVAWHARRAPRGGATPAGAFGAAGAATVAAAGAAATVSLPGVFGIFVKIGSVLFGSGYVLLAFLRTELVLRRPWLTEGQLLDAIAAGQVTPGPVFTTATFVGYLLRGPAGAAVATAGIFLPAFIFVALSGPLIPRLRASRRAAAFLDGVNVASLALMAVVSAQLARTALTGPASALIALAAAVALLRFRVSPTWLLVAGAALGLGVRFVAS